MGQSKTELLRFPSRKLTRLRASSLSRTRRLALHARDLLELLVSHVQFVLALYFALHDRSVIAFV
jgi:hypothetical protein